MNSFSAFLLVLGLGFVSSLFAKESPPNIIFFAVDDLCDWVGAMGHAQAKTPNIDKLANRGVSFSNAHCPGVFCAPSRSAIFTGQFASTTGCYGAEIYFHNHPELRPIQVSFAKAGYSTYGVGKLFHHQAGYIDQRGWSQFFLRNTDNKRKGWPLDSWGSDTPLPNPFPNSIYNRGKQITGGMFLEWAGLDNSQEEQLADTKRVNWACSLLRQNHDKPFFLAVGLYAPHFPNYVPKKYFDMYDAHKIKAPSYKEDDLDDLPPLIKRKKINRKRQHHDRLVELGAVEKAIHGYLAAVSYADAMLGRLLEALQQSAYAKNTVVVLWSDHGFQHGQKGDWGKHTLWERTSNVPFIWAGPGVTKGKTINATVSLIDMYPTFIEMCDLPPVQGLEGVSLVEVLENPVRAVDRDIFLPYLDPGGYAIVNQNWRYIHYSDGTEELYDLRNDPHEWNNLASKSNLGEIKKKLKASAPKSFAPVGISRNQLRLINEGESYRWELKQRPIRRN